MKAKDFLIGFLAGTIVGAAVGLLLAPQSGEKTREVIGETATKVSQTVKDSSHQLIDGGRELIDKGKGWISARSRVEGETEENKPTEKS